LFIEPPLKIATESTENTEKKENLCDLCVSAVKIFIQPLVNAS